MGRTLGFKGRSTVDMPHRRSGRHDPGGISRRQLVGVAVISTIASMGGLRPAFAQQTGRFFLTPGEERILSAAVDRILPRDEWPSATEAGVIDFLDFQLATEWGKGERLFRQGPFAEGTPTQGYQLPFTPAELYREALGAFGGDESASHFVEAGPQQQDEFLRRLEKGETRLGRVPGDTFFRMLRQNTLEGYFSDPIHNGNRGLVGWHMIGFPGAHAYYLTEVDRFDMEYRRAPTGIAYHAGREPPPLVRPIPPTLHQERGR